MRLRTPVLASAAVTAAAVAVPSLAGAAPIANHALSIHATPQQIVAGEPVLIYGRLAGRDSADQTITLFHRIAPNRGFTEIGHTTTNAAGQYEFTRAEGVVNSDRSWYVRGPVHSHSKTIHESVAAEVTINASATEGTTRHPLTFTGTVTPAHAGSHVVLQSQVGDGNTWHRVATATVGADGSYSLTNRWRTPGARNVRVVFVHDAINSSAVSDPVSVVIQQTQAPFFTIATSAPIVADGSPATISGTVDQANTSTPEAATEVGLYEHVPGSGAAATLAQTTTTGSTGGYSFTVQSETNELYEARTVNAPTAQRSADLFQGVQDTVTMSTSAADSTVGGAVTFSGSVAPSKAGHVVYLERLDRNGHWQIVETSTISSASTFSFPWTFGTAGTKQFRARVVGGDVNVGGASAPVTETVAQPSVGQLPSIG